MRKKISACLSVLAAVALSLLSCQKAEGPATVGNGAVRLIFSATLGNAAVSATRADDDLSRDDHYDNWSYRHFQKDDNLGFFSSHGDMGVGDGAGPIINWPLVCTTDDTQGPYQFESNDLFSFTHMTPNEIFLYYPYREDIAEDNGMELRRLTKLTDNVDEKAVERCVDFLVGKDIEASLVDQQMLLSGKMVHAFSELIIVRGKGFDNPPPGKETITVVMQKPYSHIRINCSPDGSWSCKPELISVSNDEKYRKWEAWQGTNFGITEEDKTGVAAWYALLPTLEGNRTAVESIEIWDNEGQLRTVSSLKLADGGKSKYLDPGWQYPMKISIEELVPTVNPYPIIPWNKETDGEDTDLTNERKRGIHSRADFEMWQEQYALYLKGSNNEEELFKYGDLTKDADGNHSRWHFYILNDLDFSNYPYGKNGEAVIPELKDILDGASTTLENHTFLNHQLKGLKRPLVDKLSGSLLNMDFIRPDISLDSTEPVGVLANSAEEGTIDNCLINFGTVMSAGPVGMAVGSIRGGSVTNSSFSGTVIGNRSYSPDDNDTSIRFLFGEAPTNGTVLEGNFSEVHFFLR